MSAYPHPEGSSDPIKKFEATIDGVDDAAMQAFYAGNIESLMGQVPAGT